MKASCSPGRRPAPQQHRGLRIGDTGPRRTRATARSPAKAGSTWTRSSPSTVAIAALTWSVSPNAPIWTNCGPAAQAAADALAAGQGRDLDRAPGGTVTLGAGCRASSGVRLRRWTWRQSGCRRRAGGIVGQRQKLHPHPGQAPVVVAELARGRLRQVDQPVADERARDR